MKQKNLKDYQALYQKDPTNADNLMHWGDLLVINEKLEEALEKYDLALKYAENDCSKLFRCGETRLKLRQYETAIKDFDKVIKQQPHHCKALFMRAKSKFYLEQYHKAIRDANRVLALKEDFGALKIKALSNIKLDRLKVAMEDLLKMSRILPNDMWARETYSRIMFEDLRRWDEGN